MKKNMFFAAILCVSAMMQSAVPQENSITAQVSLNVENKPAINPNGILSLKDRILRLHSLYAGSLLMGAFVGAITGSVVGAIERKLNVADSPIGLFLFILSWCYEPIFRGEFLGALQSDFDFYGIAHKKDSMIKAAWIASWIAYYRSLNLKIKVLSC